MLRQARWLALRGAALAGGSLFLLLVMVAFGGWYTSRPQFCRSCHIMEPYFDSWQASSHRDVSCIECHFAPGFGGEVRGKMLGLVQLAKYVTQSEGPRPAAEIPDASCLRAGCHETRLLSGRVDFHGVSFDHAHHLGDLRRGKTLRCTSCHSQIVQGEHMAVTISTCFLCHFKDQPFNEGLGTCTRCHQIPEKEYDLGGGVKFTHELAYQKGVDCINCHGDVIRGKGEVPLERCRVCHNRQSDLAKINDHTFIHSKHVSEHKIDCTDCHLEIQHSLAKDKPHLSASDCASCHPNHHAVQLQMFAGVGGKTVPGRPGGMLVTRLGCRSCHRVQEVSSTGSVLWKASAEVCSTCHDAAAISELEAYHKELKAVLDQIGKGLDQVRQALGESAVKADRAAAIRAELDRLQSDLNFLREGNGIHNIHYATALTTAVVEHLEKLSRELGIARPEIPLPKPSAKWR